MNAVDAVDGVDTIDSPAPAAGRTPRNSLIVRRRITTGVLIVAITLLTIPKPIGGAMPIGLDPSWQMMLHRLAGSSLVFGHDVVFTYGPLGFLAATGMYAETTGAAAVAVALASYGALVATTLLMIRQVTNLGIAALITGPTIALANAATGPFVTLVWILTITAVGLWFLARADAEIARWLQIVFGIAAALATLTKLDTGIAIVAIVGITIALSAFRAHGIRRVALDLTVTGGSYLATLIVGWLVSGQPVSSFFAWLEASIEFVRGYARDMGGEIPEKAWEYPTALMLALAFAALVWTASDLARREKVFVSVLAFVVAAIGFKQGFVRHDGHSVQYFSLFVFLPMTLLPFVQRVRVAAIGAVGLVALMGAGNANAANAFAIPTHVSRAADALGVIVSPTLRAEAVRDGLAEARDEHPIPGRMLRIIDGRPTIVGPANLQSAWAYDDRIGFAIVPVFQEYGAYTTALDDLNATAYADPDGAPFVLRESGYSIDGRIGRWEAPGATLELACHFQLVDREETWVLLERRARNGCGAIEPIETVDARFAAPIDVPEARGDELVVARFSGIDDGRLERLRTALFRSPPVYVGSSDDDTLSRFVIGTQASWHIVSAPECVRTMIDHPYLPVEFDDLVFSTSQEELTGDQQYRVEFARVPFECGASGSVSP